MISALALSEADTRAKLIDPAIHACGWSEDVICRETTLGQVEIIGGKPRRRSAGRTDYTLRVRVSADSQPVAVALLEAKKDTLPPGHGLEQVKAYLDACRHNVQFVFSSNGHLFVEYNRTTGMTSAGRPLSEFPSPAELRARYEQIVGFSLDEPIPYLKKLKDKPNATARQKVISEIMSGVEKTRIDTEKNLLDVLDKVHEITNAGIDPTHVFALSQIYEGLLLKMGEKGSDAGQFFTPREVIRAMVRAIAPTIGETVYDPCCGTGGFLAQAAEHMQPKLGAKISGPAIARFRQETFWGREKENLIYPIGLANLILHGIDRPNIWHGNALTGDEVYGGLFEGAPSQFDVILTNPPFGGKEGAGAQTNFDYRTSATQVLFLQLVIKSLKSKGGRCGMVIDEGVLFRTNEEAFVKTKRKLTDECDLWCILSLPGGVFSAAGAGVKTNLLFFTKGRSTDKIWYYDLSDVKVGKKTPLTLKHFEDFAAKLATREDSERSWTVDLAARKTKAADHAQPFKDTSRSKSQEANKIKDSLGELKRATPRDQAAIAGAETQIAGLLKEAREATNKAEDIENAAYDLKAVNPNRKADVDRRTPIELLDLIEAKKVAR